MLYIIGRNEALALEDLITLLLEDYMTLVSLLAQVAQCSYFSIFTFVFSNFWNDTASIYRRVLSLLILIIECNLPQRKNFYGIKPGERGSASKTCFLHFKRY